MYNEFSMKDNNSLPIIAWTKCFVCDKHQPCILAPLDDVLEKETTIQPTCIHCLDKDAHEDEGEALWEYHKQEEADNITQDLPSFA